MLFSCCCCWIPLETLVLSQNDEIIETYFPRSRPIFQGGGESLEEGFGTASRKIGIKPLKEIWTWLVIYLTPAKRCHYKKTVKYELWLFRVKIRTLYLDVIIPFIIIFFLHAQSWTLYVRPNLQIYTPNVGGENPHPF